jgi:hypothetical protein
MNIDTLLLLDNQPEMINSFVGDYHVWYGVRFHILNEIISQHDKLTLPVSDFPLKINKILKYLWLTVIRFPYFIKQRQIVFFSSNVVNMKHDGYYINRLYDFFFLPYKDSAVILEDSYRREYRTPRKQVVFYSDMIYILSALLSKFIIITSKIQHELDYTFLKIKEKVNYDFDDKFWDNIILRIKKQYKRHIVAQKIYSFLLKKIRPKIVFREDGSYGGFQALSTICNKLNIIYAEFQHGLVSRNHHAYNYGEQFILSTLTKNLLPKYFLTFGKYWSEQIRIPGKKIEVGFPYLQEKAALAKLKRQYHPGINILVVSDGTLPEFYVDLVRKLSSEKYKCSIKVIFKLHPVEVPLLKVWYGSLARIKNVVIKTYESIYDIITDADILVGCASTVMFEALQFFLKPFVYVNDLSSAHINNSYFSTFNGVDDLLRQIREEKYVVEKKDMIKNIDYIWEQHPQECFQRFINGILNERTWE